MSGRGYLKVHESLPASETPDPWLDRPAYSVQREDFSRKTLRLLRLSRAALIYLSLAMHDKERKRPKGNRVVAPNRNDMTHQVLTAYGRKQVALKHVQGAIVVKSA
ncbi:LA2681 family HEPN domain-containing protein [Bradyrhizobium sp. ORS 86]|uniref:LA2681 family HEPN domain-containing protein n=1 Tax=Bradyrhizobium sp. ORS 86 TaxID=1685970 RepID=UPI00388DB47E